MNDDIQEKFKEQEHQISRLNVSAELYKKANKRLRDRLWHTFLDKQKLQSENEKLNKKLKSIKEYCEVAPAIIDNDDLLGVMNGILSEVKDT